MAGENRNAAVYLDFGGGKPRFRLAMGELEELQELTGVGPYRCLQRLLSGEWYIRDVRDTLRLGLIGGGMSPSDAQTMVMRYVDQRPDWLVNVPLAAAVIGAALAGAPEEQGSKKGDAPKAKRKARTSRKVASPSVHSTEPPAPSA